MPVTKVAGKSTRPAALLLAALMPMSSVMHAKTMKTNSSSACVCVPQGQPSSQYAHGHAQAAEAVATASPKAASVRAGARPGHTLPNDEAMSTVLQPCTSSLAPSPTSMVVSCEDILSWLFAAETEL